MKSTVLQKLKERHRVFHSVNPPIVLSDNFLNFAEIEDIKRKIFLLSSHWQSLSNSTESLPIKLLPAGMYSRSYDVYCNNSHSRVMMEENFGSYYIKIKNKIQEYFNMEAEYPPSVNYPGFHIFTAGTYSYYNFHNDRFSYLNKFINVGKIYSIVIPITLPEFGGNLIYSFDKSLSIDKIDKNATYHIFPYKIGSMFMWEGTLTHSIEPFSLSNTESRITLQLHINIFENKISIFW